MLAEIFMLRLETAVRASREGLPSSTSQFVCYTAQQRIHVQGKQEAARATGDAASSIAPKSEIVSVIRPARYRLA